MLTVVLFAMEMPTGGVFSPLVLVIAVGCWIAERSMAAKNARIRLHLYEEGLVATVELRVIQGSLKIKVAGKAFAGRRRRP
ncbi:hypothetical protein [Streptomyces sp. NPDC059258]|uniref:hypothetical protein n=1 Tax=Streptomyces sp. NPDC059258 TaxID=3346795 RepID=UPI0036C417DE